MRKNRKRNIGIKRVTSVFLHKYKFETVDYAKMIKESSKAEISKKYIEKI